MFPAHRGRRGPTSPWSPPSAGAVDVPVVAEGRIRNPHEAAAALAHGAHSVVVGTAITAPTALTATFVSELAQR